MFLPEPLTDEIVNEEVDGVVGVHCHETHRVTWGWGRGLMMMMMTMMMLYNAMRHTV